MGSKKHRNHTHAELMEQRAKDDARRGTAKRVEIKKPHDPGVTLYNPFKRLPRTPGGIIILAPKR